MLAMVQLEDEELWITQHMVFIICSDLVTGQTLSFINSQ